MKTCSKCGEEKSIEEFYASQYWCKLCRKGYYAKSRAEHPEQHRAYSVRSSAKWYAAHREEKKAYVAKRRAARKASE